VLRYIRYAVLYDANITLVPQAHPRKIESQNPQICIFVVEETVQDIDKFTVECRFQR